MKNTLLLLAFTFLLLFNVKESSAQSKTFKNSFVIHGNNLSSDQVNFYTKSIEAVDFEKYRLKTKDVALEFRNGFELILTSADKLFLQGIQINTNDYSDDLAPDHIYPLFRIDESGIVVTMHKTRLTKSELKNRTK